MVFAGRQWYTHECKTEQCARLSLRLIPSRRITVKRGQDPLAVCCGCLLKSGGGLDLRLCLSVAFFPWVQFSLQTKPVVPPPHFHAPRLYFLLCCTAEKNQISRSRWHNALSSLSNAHPEYDCEFVRHMFKETPKEGVGVILGCVNPSRSRISNMSTVAGFML